MSIHSGFQTVVGKVPAHLRQYVVEQDYSSYTAVDQAVWRYVMRQNSHFLESRAHPAYLDGLRESGIRIESIPNIEEMDRCLSRIGWGAVTVDGFIPPSAFMDFQAHRILAIASAIRTLDHIAYTPAPDILHESAGHAPIILDEKYRSYLQLIGEIGAKAFSSAQDMQVYAAIRNLSDLKENPHSSDEQIKAAEDQLAQSVQAVSTASEAAWVSRLYWWTVEYGLIGETENPLIYGAGLLSSVGESISCLQDDVAKIPFDLDRCIATDYDITKPQPQLFVCRDFDQLITAAKELSEKLAYRIGGTYSLQKALESADTATIVYSSGLQVSGKLQEIVYDAAGDAAYIKTNGATALAVDNRELPGQGTDYHAEGFGSPIGKLKGHELALEFFMDGHLQKVGIEEGQFASLQFASGVTVRGIVRAIHRRGGCIVLISFDECTVTYQEKTLFQAQWGTYDMAVGASIVSAYPGAADKESFTRSGAGAYAENSGEPAQPCTHSGGAAKMAESKQQITQLEARRDQLYQKVRSVRESLHHLDTRVTVEQADAELVQVHAELQTAFPEDWLLRLELLELAAERAELADMRQELLLELSRLEETSAGTKQLIQNGKLLVK